jgi:hypothetical protein
MAFTVEDGTGKSDANSYTTAAFFKAYFTALGDTAMTAKADGDIETALVKASLLMDSNYRGRLQGYRVKALQALQFPRSGVCEDRYALPNNVVPKIWQQACCELAKRSFTDDLFADINAGGAGVIQKTIGPLTIKWGTGASPQKMYLIVDKMVSVYLNDGYGIVESFR